MKHRQSPVYLFRDKRMSHVQIQGYSRILYVFPLSLWSIWIFPPVPQSYSKPADTLNSDQYCSYSQIRFV